MADYALGVSGYSGYSDGRWREADPTDTGLPSPLSKSFRGRSGLVSSLGGAPPTQRYKMRAQDGGAAPPGYVTWVVVGSPDFAGDYYSTGVPTPVGPMVAGSAVVATDYEE